MVKIKINFTILAVFVILVLTIISAYFLVSIELTNMTTTSTLPKTTTIITTTNPPEETTSTTTLPYSLRKRLLDLANSNIKGKCNVTYTQVERKHFPTSIWFSDVCPKFKNYNETEIWRTDAYLNDKCNLGVMDECIQVFTSISLDEKTICVWAIDQYSAKTVSFSNLTQKYC